MELHCQARSYIRLVGGLLPCVGYLKILLVPELGDGVLNGGCLD
jgi:hypothetical protein